MPSMPMTLARPQVGVEVAVRAEVARHAGEFADDEAVDLQAARLPVLGVDAVVADERVGHRDDLAGVGRVGEDFLIAGHGGVEHDFAARSPGAPKPGR